MNSAERRITIDAGSQYSQIAQLIPSVDDLVKARDGNARIAVTRIVNLIKTTEERGTRAVTTVLNANDPAELIASMFRERGYTVTVSEDGRTGTTITIGWK